MAKIKVAILVPSLVVGGAEFMASQIMLNIDREKYDAGFVCMSKPCNTILEKRLCDAGVKVRFLGKALGFAPSCFFYMWKTLSELKPDVLHTHLGTILYVFPWAMFHRCKIVHTVHCPPKYELRSVQRIIQRFLYHINKACPVAISNSIQKEIAEMHRLNKDKIPLIYNPVDTDRFTRKNAKKVFEGLVLCCVARFYRQKNHRLLIEAFNKAQGAVPGMRLLLVGDGELRGEIKKQIRDCGLEHKVVLTGNVTDVEAYLAGSDIFILSSDFEGTPLSVVEAMCAGLPVIATAVDGVPDIISNTINGILVEARNSGALAQAIIDLAQDSALREEMGRKNIEAAKQYDVKIITAKYEALYDKTVLKTGVARRIW